MGRREWPFHRTIQIHHDGHFAIIRRHRLQEIEPNSVPHPESVGVHSSDAERTKAFKHAHKPTAKDHSIKRKTEVWWEGNWNPIISQNGRFSDDWLLGRPRGQLFVPAQTSYLIITRLSLFILNFHCNHYPSLRGASPFTIFWIHRQQNSQTANETAHVITRG